MLIESRIFQIRLNNQYQMGVNWEWIMNQGEEREKFRIDTIGQFPLSTTPAQFGRVVFGDLGREDIVATVDFFAHIRRYQDLGVSSNYG